MNITPVQYELLLACAVRLDKAGIDWSLIAREAARHESVAPLLAGEIDEDSSAAADARTLLGALPDLDDARARVDEEVAAASKVGAHLITVLDPTYPSNLKLIPNLPPFLFVRGELTPADVRSVAVVGTRDASETGINKAQRMARALADRGVTVVSGMARGIDTAAHTATLDADARTIAVIGTGTTRFYPPENRGLDARIVDSGGAVVSQFWPTSGPARWTFPRRNVVTSGISQGTVVVEASSTSGAKMQARLALEHGKRVFLLHSLVTDQEWARKYLQRPRAVEVADVEDVIRHLAAPDKIIEQTTQRQLALDLV